MRSPYVALIALIAVAVAANASAAPPRRTRPFAVTEFNGYVEAGVEGRRETRKNEGGQTTVDIDELEFKETLELELGGYLYHPRLVTYELGTILDLIQQSKDREDDSLLMGGSIYLTFLQGKPYTLSLWAREHETEIDRTLAQSYDATTSSHGARFDFKRGPLPFVATYRYDSNESNDRFVADDETEEFLLRSTYRVGEHSSGDLEGRLTRETTGSRESDRFGFSASHNTRLAEGKEMFGSFSLQDVTNDIESSSLFANGGLRWQHTRDLSSRYSVAFSESESGGSETSLKNWSLNASLGHQLYESLNTLVDVSGSFEDAPFGTRTRYGVTLREVYGKRLAEWGRLAVDLSPGVEFEERDPSQRTGFVLDEPLTLNDTLPVELKELDVFPSTIVVTDLDGLVPFVEGRDYDVTVRGPLVELRRVPTGAIGAGDGVLVDYDYRLGGGGTFRTTTLKFRTELSVLSQTSLYYGFSTIDQKEISGNVIQRLQSRTRHWLGVRVSRPWMTATLELERSQLDFQSSSPALEAAGLDELTRSLSHTVSVFTLPRSRVRASLVGFFRMVDLQKRGETQKSGGLSGSVRIPILWRGEMELEADYQIERFKGNNREVSDWEALGATLSMFWRYRAFRISVEGRIARTEWRTADEVRDRWLLRVRRDL
jgi:hypothetical protein